MKQVQLQVTGMSCAHCERAVKEALSALPGVSDVQVSLESGAVTAIIDPAQVQEAQLKEAIEEAGYDVA